MSHIAGIKFRECSPVYYFDASSLELRESDWVVVRTEEGLGMGYVARLTDEVPDYLKEESLKEVQRKATEEDMEIAKDNSRLGYEAFRYCRERIADRGLEMKLVDVEVFFDRSKIIFFFAAPGRVDFRELVKDLVKAYKTRIELRQIGVRHETQMVGAVGNCGQVCCCRRFLRNFDPVTIKMAKDQNLFLNPAKISGVCGRLLCCLAYEQENYSQFKKKLPKIGKRYHTEQGILRVQRSNLFRDSLTVLDEEGQEREMPLDEWRMIVRSQCTGNEEQQASSGSEKPSRKGRGAEGKQTDSAGNGNEKDRKNGSGVRKGKPKRKGSGGQR
ncbi:MAG: stage 0 sporulation family protein [Desulfonatronovibrionaceae bacterium]